MILIQSCRGNYFISYGPQDNTTAATTTPLSFGPQLFPSSCGVSQEICVWSKSFSNWLSIPNVQLRVQEFVLAIARQLFVKEPVGF